MATSKTFSDLLFKLISLLSLIQGAEISIISLSIENMLKVMFEAGSKSNFTYFSPFSWENQYGRGRERGKEEKDTKEKLFLTPNS